MAKGLGIIALVISILSIFVPLVSLFLVWLALIVATIAGVFDGKTFTIATFVVCLVNILFLYPGTWTAFLGHKMADVFVLNVVTIIFFIAPIAGLIFGSMRPR